MPELFCGRVIKDYANIRYTGLRLTNGESRVDSLERAPPAPLRGERIKLRCQRIFFLGTWIETSIFRLYFATSHRRLVSRRFFFRDVDNLGSAADLYSRCFAGDSFMKPHLIICPTRGVYSVNNFTRVVSEE